MRVCRRLARRVSRGRPRGCGRAAGRTLGVSGLSSSSAFEKGKLTASDGGANDQFGVSVATNGSTALMGAFGKNSGAGAAYMFVRSGTAWSQQAELTASDADTNDRFGVSEAISGSTALVGAYGKRSFAGAASMFVRSVTAWSQQAKLTASDAATGDEFGLSVALYGSTAVIGAPGKSSNTGAAYAFGNV